MNRIELLASLAKDSNVLLDLGCDHSYVLIEALKKYNVKKGIASDINEGPLKQAKQNLIDENLDSKVDLILSDGFTNINQDFDTVIIAGMGGFLIKEILAKGLTKINNKKIIIEANNNSEVVREFLTRNSFSIIDEYSIVDQNKYYEIMVFETGCQNLSKFEINYGPILLSKRETTFINFYKKKLELMESVVTKMNKSSEKVEKKLLLEDYKKIVTGSYLKNRFFINDTINYYDTYFIDDKTRPLIFIAPGGGYRYTSVRESGPVARFYNNHGYHAVVVNYRETKEEAYPKPGSYLSYVFSKMKEDKRVSKIIGLGFSAGGHCILEMTLHNKDYNIDKPDLLMLAYPVITSNEKYSHKGSFENLLFKKYGDKKLMSYLSLEKQVGNNEPDLFLFGTFTDESVNVMNSLLLLEAYKEHNLNAEYHLFPMGGHGLSLATDETSNGDPLKKSDYVSDWTKYSLKWLNEKLK